jgi:integrase
MGKMILGGWPGDKRYLTQKVQHGVWYVTVDVPRQHRETLGRKRFIRSLKTRDLKTAQSLRWGAVAQIMAEVERGVLAATGHGDASLTAWALEVREELRSVPAKAHDTREMVEEALSARLDEIAMRHGHDTAMEVHGIATGKADPLTLHLDRYLDNSGLTDRTKADVRTAVAEFEGWLTDNHRAPSVQAVDSRAAGEFRDLFLIPVKKHTRTINKKLSLLSGYWKWLTKNGVLDRDASSPWAGKSLAKPKYWQKADDEKDEPRPFTEDEMKALLAGNADADLSDLMRIAALSGLRLEEIGQLRVKDCVDEVFNIRRSKTPAGVRKVPIHSALRAIVAKRTKDAETGDDLDPEAFIFPDFPESGWDNSRTMAVSKRFATYRRSVGVDDVPPGQRRSRVDFHSFRRWFAHECEMAGHHETLVARVMGHSKGVSITYGTYSKAQPLELMKTCVESVRLPR